MYKENDSDEVLDTYYVFAVFGFIVAFPFWLTAAVIFAAFHPYWG